MFVQGLYGCIFIQLFHSVLDLLRNQADLQ